MTEVARALKALVAVDEIDGGEQVAARLREVIGAPTRNGDEASLVSVVRYAEAWLGLQGAGKAFDESKHPRGFGGRFGHGTGHAASASPARRSRAPRAPKPAAAPALPASGDLKHLFNAQEVSTSRQAHQPSKSMDDLYPIAERAQPLFENVMDHGSGVDKSLGATDLSTATPEAFLAAQAAVVANPEKPYVIIAAAKGKKRAAEKVDGKYGGDASRLTDVVRGTVLVPHVADLSQALDAVRKNLPKGWTVEKPENRFASDGGTVNTGPLKGYRDVSMLLRAPDGFLMELQVNTTKMWIAKEVAAGHHLYEERRAIVEKAAAAHRDLTPAELARVESLDAQGIKIYDEAAKA